MDKKENIEILNKMFSNNSVKEQTIKNALWMIEHLEDENQPDVILINKEQGIKFTFIHKDLKTYEEMDIDKGEVYYSYFPYKKMPYFKRYFILPRGGIGEEDIFMLNKKMEFLRKEISEQC